MSAFATILLSFILAKTILLAIVVGTTFLADISIPFYHPPRWPFGYDSSSSIFVPDGQTILERVIAAFLRWDTVYFSALAERGEYVWEQEWAFGPGWPVLVRFVVPCNQISPTMLIFSIKQLSPSFARSESAFSFGGRDSIEYLPSPRADPFISSYSSIIPFKSPARNHDMYSTFIHTCWSFSTVRIY